MGLKLRLVIDEGNGYKHMAIDEALLFLRALRKSPDTLRLYVFRPSAITLGYFQSLNDSVNMDYAISNKIPVIRRITGGGSVYHDCNGEVTYSIILGEEEVPKSYPEAFKYLAMGVIEAARYLGANAEFKPLNDGVINGRKFSGSAQARKLGAVLQHGTVMYGTDIDILAKSLKAPGIKLSSKSVKSIKERVTTLSMALGREIRRDEVIRALIKGFSKALDADIFEDSYSKEELALANSLKWKYLSKEWTYMRP